MTTLPLPTVTTLPLPATEENKDKQKQRWPDYLTKRTRRPLRGNRRAVRTMDQGRSRNSGLASAMEHSPGGTLEPPAYSQDWVLRVASRSHDRTYRNIMPPSQSRHSTDYARDLPAQCFGLVKELPDVDAKDLMAGGGGDIIGSDKTTTGTADRMWTSVCCTLQPLT